MVPAVAIIGTILLGFWAPKNIERMQIYYVGPLAQEVITSCEAIRASISV